MNMDIEVSIDRITIIAFDTGSFSEGLRDNIYIRERDFSRNFGFRYTYSGQNGECIEIGDKGKVRLDFNPNNANMNEIGRIMRCLKYPHLTRLDIAVDYFGENLSRVEWDSEKRRKRNYWIDADGTLETLYIGAPSSDKRFRIYNKELERKENSHGEWEQDWEMHLDKHPLAKHGHWRVEVQKRFKERDNILDPKEYFLPDLFDIVPLDRIDLSHLEGMDRVVVQGLISDPSLAKGLNKNTRAKYNKMIKEAKKQSPIALAVTPQQAYEKEKSRLADELTDLFAQSDRTMQQI